MIIDHEKINYGKCTTMGTNIRIINYHANVWMPATSINKDAFYLSAITPFEFLHTIQVYNFLFMASVDLHHCIYF